MHQGKVQWPCISGVIKKELAAAAVSMQSMCRGVTGGPTLRIASCILWKWVALWKCEAIILASSVDSTFANVNRIRHAIACACHTSSQGKHPATQQPVL